MPNTRGADEINSIASGFAQSDASRGISRQLQMRWVNRRTTERIDKNEGPLVQTSDSGYYGGEISFRQGNYQQYEHEGLTWEDGDECVV